MGFGSQKMARDCGSREHLCEIAPRGLVLPERGLRNFFANPCPFKHITGMANKSNGVPRNVNQNAARIVALSTEEQIPNNVCEERRLRSAAASVLGKLGGSKGGKARAARLSQERRKEIARDAANRRWSKKV